MKLTIHRQSASALLVFILIVACVTIVSVGGCVAYKTTKKLKKIEQDREKAITNELSSLKDFEAKTLADYMAQTGDTNAFALTSYSVQLVRGGEQITVRLWTSTNLTDWTLLATGPLDDVLKMQDEAMRSVNRDEPVRFFRLEAR